MDGEKKSRNRHKVSVERRERKSNTGMSGVAKKGGRGGKFTWEGADGYTDEDLGLFSKNNRGGGGRNAGKKTGDEEDLE